MDLSSQQALAEKAKWMHPSSANYSKNKQQQKLNKRAGWKMVQETSMKTLHSEERKEPYNTLNRTEQTTRTEWKIATEKKREQQQNQHHY